MYTTTTFVIKKVEILMPFIVDHKFNFFLYTKVLILISDSYKFMKLAN